MATPTSPETCAPTRKGGGHGARVRRRRLRIGNVLFSLVVVVVSAAWFGMLRPQALGGQVGYVMIRGISMDPLYRPGDLVLVRRQSSYVKGDIIAYRIPAGDIGAGIVVIHRIVGGTPRRGFVTQGDNNPDPDDWHPKPPDILGTPMLLVPKVGVLLAFLHAPLPLASLSAGIAVAVFLSRDPEKARSRSRRRGKQPRRARSSA